MTKKGFAPILVLVIILILGVAGFGAIQSFKSNTNLYPVPTGTGETANLSSDENLQDWKTYRNEEYGFEIQYPPDFFVKTSDINKIQISNNSLFEEDEFSLIITLEPLSKTNYRPSDDPRIIKILEKVGYQNLAQKFSYHASGNFEGDPPRGYYEIAIASQDINKDSILITTTIHRIDELSVSEGGTDGKLAEQARQILSTFEFIESTENATKKECGASGCWGQFCGENLNPISDTLCVANDIFRCYAKGICERQSDGKCGWTNKKEIDVCLGQISECSFNYECSSCTDSIPTNCIYGKCINNKCKYE